MKEKQEIIITEKIIENVPTRKQLGTEIKGGQQSVVDLISKNEDSIKHLDLDILQLLEQGKQVIKPWERSWQLGVNYWWHREKGKDKYPFNLKFERSKNVFVRSTGSSSDNYGEIEKLIKEEKKNYTNGNFIYSYNDKNNEDNEYLQIKIPKEYPMGISFAPDIKPKSINDVKVIVKEKEIVIPSHQTVTIPEPIGEPNKPNIQIQTFKPISPDITIPTMPQPSNLVFLAYADANFNHNTYLTDSEVDKLMNDSERKKIYKDKFEMLDKFEKGVRNDKLQNYIKEQLYYDRVTSGNIFSENFQIYHNTWGTEGNGYNIPENLTFKSNYIGGVESPGRISLFNNNENRSNVVKIDSFNPSIIQASENKNIVIPQPNGLKNDSSLKNKFARENAPEANNYKSSTHLGNYTNDMLGARNRQYFMVGGGRGFEFDQNSESNVLPGTEIKLFGPLVFGVTKQDVTHVFVYANISDKDENEDIYIKAMPIDNENYLKNTYIDKAGNEKELLNSKGKYVLLGPVYPSSLGNFYSSILTENPKFAEYRIRKSNDGYVGYKIGIAQIEEETTRGKIINRGEIELYGEKSIGMYAYSPMPQRCGTRFTNYLTDKKGVFFSFENMQGVTVEEIEQIADESIEAFDKVADKNGKSRLLTGSNSRKKVIDRIKQSLNKYASNAIFATDLQLINDKGEYPKWNSNEKILDEKKYTVDNNYTGKIMMSGYNSYGMKWSMQTGLKYNNNLSFKNKGEILLRKNPNSILNTPDKADKSIGMAALVDESFFSIDMDIFYKQIDELIPLYAKRQLSANDDDKLYFVELYTAKYIYDKNKDDIKKLMRVTIPSGRIINEGEIYLTDNIAGSIGMYVNIASDMTNKGLIKITANPEKYSNPDLDIPGEKDKDVNTLMNIGMYAKQVSVDNAGALVKINGQDPNTTVINDEKGYINLLGNHSVGMVAEGQYINVKYNDQYKSGAIAQGINKGTIDNKVDDTTYSTDENEKVFAMIAKDGGKIENTGTIDIQGFKNSIGMIVKKENGNVSSGVNSGSVIMKGNMVAGIYNEGSFTMSEPQAKIAVDGNQSIAIYAKNTDDTILSGGNISVSDGALALYPDESTITLDNSNNNLTFDIQKGGLFIYNYPSNSTSSSLGKLSLNSNVDVNIHEGATGVYAKDLNVVDGKIVGLDSFFDNLIVNNGSEKLNFNMNDDSTLILFDGSKGNREEIKLSGFGNNESVVGNKVNVSIGVGQSGNYSLLSIYKGKFLVDKSTKLGSQDDLLDKINMMFSSITVEAKDATNKQIEITGDQPGKVLFYQNNYIDSDGNLSDVKITNNGIITLTGDSIPKDTANNKSAKTTTVLGGGAVTVTNNGTVNALGSKSIATYGSKGTVINNTGTIYLGNNSIGIYGVSKDDTLDSTVGTENISIANSGTITLGNDISNGIKIFGIYGNNNSEGSTNIQDNKIINTDTGVIDLSSAKNSVGIYAENATLDNNGKIVVKNGSTAIKIKDSNYNENGAKIELKGSSVAYDIIKTPGKPTIQNFDSEITASGKANTVFIYENEDVNPINGNINIHYTYENPDNRITYYGIKNSVINMDNTWSMPSADIAGFTFISAENSRISINQDIVLNKENSAVISSITNPEIAATQHINGQPDIKTDGTMTLKGDNSIGIYAGGVTVENNSKIKLSGSTSTAIIALDSVDVKNNGDVSLGNDSVGIYVQTSGEFMNSGDIEIGDGVSPVSDSEGIALISIDNAINNGNISLTGNGEDVVGIYAAGLGTRSNQIINNGNISISGNNDTDHRNIGIYVKLNGPKLINNAMITTGENSIGISASNLETGMNSDLKVGKSGIAVLSHNNSDINMRGKLQIAAGEKGKETIGVHNDGSNSNIKLDLDSIILGKNSIGVSFAKKDGNNTVVINSMTHKPTVELPGDSIYVYSVDETPDSGSIKSYTNLKTATSNSTIVDGNYGYYVSGQFENYGKIDFSNGLGSIGIFSTSNNSNMKPAINRGTIEVAQSDIVNNIYGIGMGAGHIEKDDDGNIISQSVGNIVNEGIINVNNNASIGMYAAGEGSTAINRNTINITGKKGIGMYLGKGATGINESGANINIEAGADGAMAIFVDNGAILKNYGNITINESSAKGIFQVTGGKIEENTTDAPIHEYNAMTNNEKIIGDVKMVVHKPGEKKDTNITVDGKSVTPIYFDRVSENPNADYTIDNSLIKPNIAEAMILGHKNEGAIFDKIGMYVDTSGINFTHPIKGKLKVEQADLIIGTEATQMTNAKSIIIGENIFNEYNMAILNNPQVEKWNVLSGSLTWAAVPNQFKGSQLFKNIVMTKVKYTDTIEKDSKIYNFMDGMEQRYGMNALDSKEKQLFNKINMIGKNEEALYKQAVSEMIGRQYVNTAKRVMSSHNGFYREFDDLMNWQTNTKDTMKVKFFGEHNKVAAKKDKAIGYKRDVQGVFVLNNNETVRLGESSGMFLGMANEQFKFKDIGGSKEKAITGQIGYYKSNAYGYNNELNWTWKAGLEGSYRKMDRRYLVVDDIFHGKSKYHSYGVFLDNTLGVNYRVSEHFAVEPYAGLDLTGGRIGKIHENSGEMRLDIKAKDYVSVLPNAGVEVRYDTPLETNKLVASVDANVSREFGNIENAQMRARVNRTTADYYRLPREKREKIDLGVVGRIGIENENYGVAAKVGYSTVDKALNGGLEFRMKF